MMNKKFIATITALAIPMLCSTALAAEADLPSGHWAFDAVSQLAADGHSLK